MRPIKGGLLKENGGWLALWGAVVGIMVLWSRFAYLISQSFLMGPDAYYYALQLKYFAQTGFFKIADNSLLLPLMGLTAKLGWGYEQTVIVWTILIQLLCGLSIVTAGRMFYRQTWFGLGTSLGMYLLISPATAFLAILFPKHAFALVFLPLWPTFLINRRFWPVTIVAVLLSGISHASMFGLAVLLLGVAFLRGKFGWRLISRQWAVFVVLLLAGLFGLIWSQKFLLLSDLQRFSWEGLRSALWTFLGREGIPIIIRSEVGLALIALAPVLFLLKSAQYEREIGLFWLPFILFLLFIPIGSKEEMGIAERFSLLVPVVAVNMLLGFKIGKLPLKKFGLILLLGSMMITATFTKAYYNLIYPDGMNPDYPLYHQVTTAIAAQKIPMLIAHQGLNYYYKYQTMQESFPYEPESHWPKERIWRIVYGIRPAEWGRYLPENYLWGSRLLLDLPGPYALIREDGWNEFRNRVSRESQDDDLRDRVFHTELNPSQKRPDFSRSRTREKDAGEFSAYPKQ